MQRTETFSVGIQNKNTLKTLLLRRLAAKNNPKNRAATIQNRGEKALSASPPTIAASPVAFSWLVPLKADQGPGTHSARIIAASALRMPLTYSITFGRTQDYTPDSLEQFSMSG